MKRRITNVLAFCAGAMLAAVQSVAAQPPVAEEITKQSVTSIVRETMLGAIAVLAVVVAIWAIRAMRDAMKDRVTDKDDLSKRLELSNEKDRLALGEQTKAITSLAEAVKDQTRVVNDTRQAAADLVKAVDGVVRDAVNLRRSGQSGATHQAVRPKRDV